jgi:hypothetical protein
MGVPSRVVLPETLDSLDPGDPRAHRSRQDLRRVHRAMRTVSIVRDALRRLRLAASPRRILELGGGDGSLMLRLARAMRPWPDVVLTILDLHDIVSPQTLEGYAALGWRVQVHRQDVMAWAAEPKLEHYDLCMTNLFLHHFADAALPVLMHAIAGSCDAFVACEPHRNALGKLGSAMIGILGTNRVTREDAMTSVAAGFTRQELTALWPNGNGQWSCEEYTALPFTHCFNAALIRGRREAAP